MSEEKKNQPQQNTPKQSEPAKPEQELPPQDLDKVAGGAPATTGYPNLRKAIHPE
jgi:hypothetical protein